MINKIKTLEPSDGPNRRSHIYDTNKHYIYNTSVRTLGNSDTHEKQKLKNKKNFNCEIPLGNT